MHLYQDIKTHHPIYDLDLPFADYITACQKMITDNRPDIKNDREKILAANSPFELCPKQSNDRGVLLIHGLLESPVNMKDIGEHFFERGYLVRSIMLPGHCTIPGDLLSTNYEDWIQAVRYGIASLKKDVKKIYLIGFSTGASLALHHVLHHHDIEKAVLIAPAIKIRSYLDFSSNWHRIISWCWERAKWLTIADEVDLMKYQSMPFNAAYQVYRLTRLLKKTSKTHQPKCPLFYIASMADTTISSVAILNYFKKYFHPENQLLLYSSKSIRLQNKNMILRTSIYPELHIKEISHIGLPISPNNPHYGRRGDYVHASRMETNNTIYGGFSQLENKFFHFLYKNRLIKKMRCRLTFNPDFDFMMEKIISFFSTPNQ